MRLGLGNTSMVKWFEGIGQVRIDWGPGYRICLARDGDTLIVLFGGGTKATQRKDIVQARPCMPNTRPANAAALRAANPGSEPWH